MRAINEKFADLGTYRRVWAIGAINGDRERLATLHDHLATRFAVRDRLVYLGNYLGTQTAPDVNAAVLDELLSFRSALLCKSGMEPSDIVHLRGPSEEAWQRLLRLQFTPSPTRALESLLEAGAEAYLRLYGASLTEARAHARIGSVAITRWTNQLRMAQRMAAGHEPLACSMKRAAFSSPAANDVKKMLFVPAGFDPRRSLDDQGDALWFGADALAPACSDAVGYQRIVRGVDPLHRGINTDDFQITLDGGTGRGGPLACGCFDETGRLCEIIAIGGRGAVEAIQIKDRSVAKPSLAPLPLASFWSEPPAVQAQFS